MLVVLAIAVPLGAALLRDDEAAPSVAQDQRGPVILVPGYGGSTRSLIFLQSYLTSRGRDVTVLDLPGDGTGDLRDAADRLADVVDDLLDSSGAPSVDLVGYSAGGEIVRWYVAVLGGAFRTRRVVTLGSPHHGTDLAALASGVAGGACPEACQQLAPDSDLLRELNEDETPAGPLYTAIWTENDATVVPADSGSLEGALTYAVQDVCPDLEVSHAALPQTGPTLQMVEAALGTGKPQRPDADICDRAIRFAG